MMDIGWLLLRILAFHYLILFDFAQSRITRRSLTERIKVPLSVLASTGIVSLVESGLLAQFNSSSTWEDVPAGVLGALTFAAFCSLGLKLASNVKKRNIS